jgi:hypothetical protein
MFKTGNVIFFGKWGQYICGGLIAAEY